MRTRRPRPGLADAQHVEPTPSWTTVRRRASPGPNLWCYRHSEIEHHQTKSAPGDTGMRVGGGIGVGPGVERASWGWPGRLFARAVGAAAGVRGVDRRVDFLMAGDTSPAIASESWWINSTDPGGVPDRRPFGLLSEWPIPLQRTAPSFLLFCLPASRYGHQFAALADKQVLSGSAPCCRQPHTLAIERLRLVTATVEREVTTGHPGAYVDRTVAGCGDAGWSVVGGTARWRGC